ncbi:zinc-binding dehydrogenase [Limnohabitans sp. Rim8]|uniref:zinc-binding dehydrogenase n=1 Tax=Limnohabitans sp. Rim8 TaxID=1100718 RepID=UPI0033058CE4
MQAYTIKTVQDQSVVELVERDEPALGPTQMRIQMHAASLNRGEFIVGHGLHGKSEVPQPVGLEGAGRVLEIGAEVKHFVVGQRVMGRCPGAFAVRTVMDEREAMPIPEILDWNEAAAVPLTYLTAYDAVHEQGQLKQGEWLLINGVTSGVGVAALQMAKAIGAHVIGTSGSTDKLAKLQGQGLSLSLHTRQADFHDAVMHATQGQGVHLAVNTVGGSVFAEDIRCLAFEGRLAMVGYVDGELNTPLDLHALHAKRLRLFGVSNKLRNASQKAASIPAFMKDIWPALNRGEIRPFIDQVFPFSQLTQAKDSMQANNHVGKVVLSMP